MRKPTANYYKCIFVEKIGMCLLKRYGTCVYEGMKECPKTKEASSKQGSPEKVKPSN